MKFTVLQIVQDVLSDMSSDVINSIDDTEESTQVAQLVQSTYQAMMSSRNWPHTRRLVHLSASANSALPTHMTIDEDIKEMISIYYDKRKSTETRFKYEEVIYKEPDDFLRIVNARNSDNTNVTTVTDPSGIILLIYNDKAPQYYTSFDDETIVFDSFDTSVDSTLQSNKTQARAYVTPTFSLTDEHTPDLPEEAFSALIEMVKARAQLKLHQVEDVASESEAKRQQSWLSRKSWRVNGGIKYPNYGRGRSRTTEATFRNEN